MSHEIKCPHCGCPVLATDHPRTPDSGTVELLTREVEHLRATVARLRGAGFSPPQVRQDSGANPSTP